MSSVTPGTFLVDPIGLGLQPAGSIVSFGPTLVVAPHPDDESLGCGGAIRLLRDHGLPVTVVFFTNGTGSHPNSRRYPAPALGRLRAGEACDALSTLGVERDCIRFMALPDGYVPGAGNAGFDDAVAVMAQVVDKARPSTVLLPWRRDPHSDHRAAWQIAMAALTRNDREPPRTVEYAIWLWDNGLIEDWPQPDEVHAWRLDITFAAAAKRRAIACHASQTTDLIDDDPNGFRLSQEMIDRFSASWEIYLEPVR